MKIQLDSEVIDAIEAGQKIQAIKVLRSQTGIGLKEAKNTVENYIVENGLTEKYENNSLSGFSIIFIILVLAYVFYRLSINNN